MGCPSNLGHQQGGHSGPERQHEPRQPKAVSVWLEVEVLSPVHPTRAPRPRVHMEDLIDICLAL